MAGKNVVPPAQQTGFLDPKVLPTTNNPPKHKAMHKPKSSDSKINPQSSENKKEIGGRDGAEPTRFGDWEKNGRCVDF